ncbi:phospholipase [Legionella sp. W05-934-2]|jgi:hypothetical protein|uniref:phospholipase n=1 Tax=Legionella sp. W05-934-2 TaxID=1198649 RepID=UPI0034635296
MRKDITHGLLLSLIVFISPLSVAATNYDALIEESFNNRKAGFANLEHRGVGNQVILKWGDLPHPHDNNQIQLSNNLILTYGELIMFAGDLFGSNDRPISNCPIENREACFYSQFLKLDAVSSDTYQNALIQVPVYRQYFDHLSNQLENAKLSGESEWHFYHEHGAQISKKLNRLSGGGSFVSDYIPFGEYISLANVNYDHFYPDAHVAYKAGHQAALKVAIKAHQAYSNGDITIAHSLLSQAYAMNGFANHFLTDAMSSGHLRTPRRAIAAHIYLPKALCLLIANLMHDEDNRTGLNVTNQRGISWRAYGDGFLNTPDAAQHLGLIQQIVQESADAIYAAFETGMMPQAFEEMTLLPDSNNLETLDNHPPLFKWENNQLLKRKNNFDINDDRYTSWWSGILTLIDFNRHNPS